MPLRALFYRRPSEPQTFQVVFDRMAFPVRVRRHRQARRYTLRIHAATREVILTMPPRGSLREAKEFAQKHGGWIAARLDRLPQAVPFAEGTVVPLRGVGHYGVFNGSRFRSEVAPRISDFILSIQTPAKAAVRRTPLQVVG